MIVASAPNIEARLPDLRAALSGAGPDVESGASAFDGLIVVRLLGRLVRPIAHEPRRVHCRAWRTQTAAVALKPRARKLLDR